MKFLPKLSISLVSVLALSSCSSIVSKTEYPVTISSTPDSSSFIIKDAQGKSVHSGTTPAVVNLKASSGYFKSAKYTLILSHEGYEDKTYTFSASLDGWYWGNIIFGGLIGMLIVDPATGAMYKLPPRIDNSLINVSATENNELTIATIDELPLEDLARLEPVDLR
ncbi:hypothetical protein [Agaribacterium haliotis]|uniref:hypothetical protein n=1 Tax=Agaribacterium haliotis TaxID=2013869 RepID=UPI000BB5766D|nr:hypothetical protein [Agaribacterium haliotis]